MTNIGESRIEAAQEPEGSSSLSELESKIGGLLATADPASGIVLAKGDVDDIADILESIKGDYLAFESEIDAKDERIARLEIENDRLNRDLLEYEFETVPPESVRALAEEERGVLGALEATEALFGQQDAAMRDSGRFVYELPQEAFEDMRRAALSLDTALRARPADARLSGVRIAADQALGECDFVENYCDVRHDLKTGEAFFLIGETSRIAMNLVTQGLKDAADEIRELAEARQAETERAPRANIEKNSPTPAEVRRRAARQTSGRATPAQARAKDRR